MKKISGKSEAEIYPDWLDKLKSVAFRIMVHEYEGDEEEEQPVGPRPHAALQQQESEANPSCHKNDARPSPR